MYGTACSKKLLSYRMDFSARGTFRNLLRKVLIRIHFLALAIAVINFIFKNYTPYSLEGRVDFGVELVALGSGLAAFFFYMKPFKKVSFYFSIYPFLAVLTIFALITKTLVLG